MRKIKTALLWVILAMMSFTAACAGAHETEEPAQAERTKISVTVKHGTEHYAQVAALEDVAFMEELETRLGVDIEVRYIEPDWAMDRIDSIPFEDVLITDESYWMAFLAENKLIKRLPRMLTADATYGVHSGYQYAYVFEDTAPEKTPYILVLPDALERAGIKRISYTPESVRDMLIILRGVPTEPETDAYRYPLAVCGDPLDAGFCILQQMYGLAPRGGRECSMGDGTVIFDKLTQNGYDYISYLHTLYEEGLVSPELLILQENANVHMMSNHISAIGVYTDALFVKETVSNLQNKGIHVAYATLPVDVKGMETDVYKRLIGMVHSKSPNEDLVQQVLVALDGYEHEQMPEDPLEGLEEYPLFRKRYVRPHATDPFEEQPYNALSMYRIFENDGSMLESFYQQAVISGTDTFRFNTMVNGWLSLQRGDVNERTTGASMLRLAASSPTGLTK